jgi:plasmid stabilization system protein ParE
MSRRIILNRLVPHDMQEIADYLERDSVEVADRFLQSVFAAMDDLAAMPGKGSLKLFRSRRTTGVRSWAVPGFRNHLIFYRYTDDAIFVLAVMHGARKIWPILRNRLPDDPPQGAADDR